MYRIFINLLRREWRNERALIAGSAAILPFLLILLYWAHFDFHTIAPAVILAIFSGALAADCASSDAAGNRLETLTSLPVGARAIWFPKAFFVMLTIAAFAMFMIAADAVAARLFHSSAMTNISVGAAAGGFILFGWLTAACVSVTSTACANPLAGVVSGFIVTGGVIWIFKLAGDYLDFLGYRPEPGFVAAAAGAVTAVVGSLTFFSFCYLRSSAIPKWRPFIVRVAALAIVSILFVAGGHAAARSTALARPGDPDISIQSISPSPDGRYAAVAVYRNGKNYSSGFVWILDITNRSMTPVDGFRSWPAKGAWERDGYLQLFQASPGSKPGEETIVLAKANLANGAIVETAPLPASELSYYPSWVNVQYQAIPSPTGKAGGESLLTVRWAQANKSKQYKSRRLHVIDTHGLVVLQKPGAWIGTDETGRLFYYNLNDDSRRLLHDGPVDSISLSKDERRVIVRTKTEVSVLDVETAAVTAGPWNAKDGWRDFLNGDDEGRFITNVLKRGLDIYDTAAGRTLNLDIRLAERAARAGASEKIIYIRNDDAVCLMNFDGGGRELLYR